VTLHIPASGAFTGFFDNSETTFDGTIDDSGDLTYGDTENLTGTAVFGKNTIKMTIVSSNAFNSNFREYGYSTTHEYSVTRVGP
jgi:hypothetical protein